ncbi:SDR family NAD(P)-dependent oxidoreductase [Polymorphospora sp. NPDC050346]|uniref:SDR family NAD(P)-dependent oxidoreductase n=1 Tax=Polymorphospora sp. NPDC050346 TaxID=3155780 RepID=UPI0033C7AB48
MPSWSPWLSPPRRNSPYATGHRRRSAGPRRCTDRPGAKLPHTTPGRSCRRARCPPPGGRGRRTTVLPLAGQVSRRPGSLCAVARHRTSGSRAANRSSRAPEPSPKAATRRARPGGSAGPTQSRGSNRTRVLTTEDCTPPLRQKRKANRDNLPGPGKRRGRPAAAGTVAGRAVSSGAHLTAPFVFDDPHFARRPYDRWSAYGQSKTADVLLAVGIARRWAADGITANAVNPGWVMTNLQRHVDDDTMRALGAMDEAGDIIEQPSLKSLPEGAATSVLLAASPLVEGVSGRYFEDNREAEPAPEGPEPTGGVAAHALDPEAADRLWAYAARSVATAR